MGWQQNIFQLVIIEGTGQGSGLFIYSGAPGPANPPVLSAVAPGTTADPFGNPVIAVLELRGSAGVMTITDPAVIKFLAGATTTGTIRSESAAQSLQIDAPNDLSITSGDVILGSTQGGGHAHIFAGSDSTASTPLAWIPIIPANFQNGWTGIFKWRYGAENEIKFQAGLNAPGAGGSVDGTVITNLFGVTLPVAQFHSVTTNAIRTGAAGVEGPGLALQANGNVTCFGIAAAATTVTGVGFWPLDN